MQILDAYKEALGIIGKRFEEGTYFVPELILAGEMMKTASELIKPLMTRGQSGTRNQEDRQVPSGNGRKVISTTSARTWSACSWTSTDLK